MGSRVLIVDDERDLAELLAYNLKRAGYDTLAVHDGRSALDSVPTFRPDLIVLDIMMPGFSGTEVAERLQRDAETRTIPIVMLTAKDDERDELAALSAGADDYVTKPFSMRVLEARMQAVLRRAGAIEAGAPSKYQLGPLTVDTGAHEALLAGAPLALTSTEFKLLEALIAAEGRVLTRQSLIARALGPGVTVTERTIDVHVTALRKKFGDYAGMLRTVRGVGYRLIAPADLQTNIDPATSLGVTS